MLTITIPGGELWDESKEEFIQTRPRTLQLEHSLVSLSKWESRWHKAFLSKDVKTSEETMDYVKCMTLTQNVDPEVYTRLSSKNISEINRYIEDPMTATTFLEEKRGRAGREKVTAEVIYHQMIALNIPFECQKWHLNRLLVLIRVCDIKNRPQKRRSGRALMSRNAALNAQRRRELNTRG